MKRYIRCTDDSLKFPITGRFTTKRGKDYYYDISISGRVEVREQYTEHKSTGGYRIKDRYLYKVPMEMQRYLIETYGQQLSEIGITLSF